MLKKLWVAFALLGVITSLTACTLTVGFTISFDSNGGTDVASVKTNGNTDFPMPNDPSREGFVFSGWYWDDESFQESFTMDSYREKGIKANLTVYAKWVVLPVDEIKLIAAEGFLIVGNTALIKCPNDQEQFDFQGKFTVSAGATWAVTSDLFGNAAYLSKIMPLAVGDNIAYLWIMNGTETAMITLTIRRKPMYDVMFQTNGGSIVAKQSVEEDDFAAIPDSPVRQGYLFLGWEFDFQQIITGSTVIQARWEEELLAYLDETGEQKTIRPSLVTYLTTPSSRTLTGWYVLSGQVSGEFKLTVQGEANLILLDGANWVVNGGIVVTEGNTLHIYAQRFDQQAGTLSTSANIGGVDGADGLHGTSVESGLNLHAGNGFDGKNGGSSGSIFIHGGVITAINIGGGNGGKGGTAGFTSMSSVQGIGGNGGNGGTGGFAGNSGIITIHQGIIRAQNIGGGNGGNGGGGTHGAYGSNGHGQSGNGGEAGIGGNAKAITIYGGIVQATNIGGGNGGTGGFGSCGTGGNTPGIGGRGMFGGDHEILSIHGGTVTATHIGGGRGGHGGSGSTCQNAYDNGGHGGRGSTGGNGSILITSGNITASSIGSVMGGNGGAGGSRGTGGNLSGYGGNGGEGGFGSSGGFITIEGGWVMADSIGDVFGGNGGKGGSPEWQSYSGNGGTSAQGSKIVVSGGTIIANTMGNNLGGKNGDDDGSPGHAIVTSVVTITGGSIHAQIMSTPKNGTPNGNRTLSMVKIVLEGSFQKVQSGTIAQAEYYNLEEIQTDEEGCLYLWLERDPASLLLRIDDNTHVRSDLILTQNNPLAGTTTGFGKFFNGTETTITATTVPGYTWLGWYFEGTKVTDRLSYPVIMPNRQVTYEARWEANALMIVFDKQQGIGGTDTAIAIMHASMPSAAPPSRSGYRFQGYYNDPTAGVPYYNANMASVRVFDQATNLTLYARWIPNTYKITFDRQGGTGGSSEVDAAYELAMPTAVMPSRPGYVFLGYYDQLEGGTAYYSETMASLRPWDKTEAMTLYARWMKVSLVTFDRQGGIQGSSSVTAVNGLPMPAATKPKKTGYQFAGYFDAIDQGVQYYSESMVGLKNWDSTEDVTLYARWIPLTFQVTLDMQNGQGGTSQVSATFDAAMPSATAPTRTNYLFSGYYDQKAGGTQYYDETMNSIKTWDKTSAITLYAKWRPIGFMNGNGIEADPYLISDAAQFRLLATFVNNGNSFEGVFFALTQSIRFQYTELVPIGLSDTIPFSGNFDGRGFELTEIYLNEYRKFMGVFGYNKGNIRNLGIDLFLKPINPTGSLFAGGLAGYSTGTITNVKVRGNVHAGYTKQYPNCTIIIGGIIGAGSGKIAYSSANVSVAATNWYEPMLIVGGGVIGSAFSMTIQNTESTGSVSLSGSQSFAGGLVGQIKLTTITNSYSTSKVSITHSATDAFAGGLVGYGDTSQSKITNSYAAGIVSVSTTAGSSYAGGLAGALYSPSTWTSIVNSYSLGEVSATAAKVANAYAGKLVGKETTVLNCYVNGIGVVKRNDTVSASNTIGLNAFNMQYNNSQFFRGTLNWSTNDWDFSNLYYESGLHPKLKQ